VTTLKRAELDLRRNKELVRLAAVLMDSADAIALVEDDGRVSAWNRGAERLYGYAEREAVGLPFKVLVPGTHRDADLAALEAVRRGAPVPPWETCRVARNGRVLDVLVTASRLGGHDGGAPAVSLIERDQTELKKLLADLQFRSDRTAAILEAAADPIVTLDSNGVIESVNPATERLFGWPLPELVGRHIGALVPGNLRGRDGRPLAPPLIAAGEVGAQEVACLHRDGTAFVAELSTGQVDHMPLFVWIFRDATAQKRLEREVLEIAADAQERIGRELHDSVGQELTGMRLMVESMIGGLRENGSGELGLAERVGAGLRATLGRVRALSRGLVAAETDGPGLARELAAVAARVGAATTTECAFEATGPAPAIDASAATNLLRIAQEAVTNALRHSGATHVTVGLHTAGGTTELRIRDDGTGFTQPTDGPPGGLGLKLMRYRAGLIGARLRVDTGPTGTVVTCTLPPPTGAEP
jgi:PAS domain S-box-containing protein